MYSTTPCTEYKCNTSAAACTYSSGCILLIPCPLMHASIAPATRNKDPFAKTVPDHVDSVLSYGVEDATVCCFDKRGAYLAVGYATGVVVIWDFVTRWDRLLLATARKSTTLLYATINTIQYYITLANYYNCIDNYGFDPECFHQQRYPLHFSYFEQVELPVMLLEAPSPVKHLQFLMAL